MENYIIWAKIGVKEGYFIRWGSIIIVIRLCFDAASLCQILFTNHGCFMYVPLKASLIVGGMTDG
jgi:hypothetical protein